MLPCSWCWRIPSSGTHCTILLWHRLKHRMFLMCLTHHSSQLLGRRIFLKPSTLMPEKCFWYLVNFGWWAGKWFYKTCTQQPASITICNAHQQWVYVLRLEPLEAHWTLGVWLTPNSNMKMELTYLIYVAKEWQQKMWCSHIWQNSMPIPVLQCYHVQTGLSTCSNNIYWRRMQSNHVTWPEPRLPAAGFVQTFPRAIVHGPLQYHLNIPNLFTEQITAHIEVLLKYQDQRSNLTGIFSYMSGEVVL